MTAASPVRRARTEPESTVHDADAFAGLERQIAEASGVLKSMANETRLKILCALHEGELSVNALAQLTGQPVPAVSQHLARLRAAGLVVPRRSEQTIYYSAAPGVGRAVIATLCGYYR